ncbi:hypothetical protein FHT02_003383 [Sphingomonas xinjiangensis]|uniref:Uncharacterized protein n=1 Tax=Sphingomonas xinjiangensis TaxID=643568 RepID=A0A840YNX6_9SPHN|nr:hypothetical protein [Sphingomonas xinjiangensis]
MLVDARDRDRTTFDQRLKSHTGLIGQITESASGSSQGIYRTCEAVAKEAMAALRANSDVLSGILWWGGGCICP